MRRRPRGGCDPGGGERNAASVGRGSKSKTNDAHSRGASAPRSQAGAPQPGTARPLAAAPSASSLMPGPEGSRGFTSHSRAVWISDESRNEVHAEGRAGGWLTDLRVQPGLRGEGAPLRCLTAPEAGQASRSLQLQRKWFELLSPSAHLDQAPRQGDRTAVL